VPVYPRISNHTDLDALRMHAGVDVRFVGPGEPLPCADLVVLPGSKNVRADLEFLQAQGWARALSRHLRYGGKLVALCGGMQMLGRWIHDPDGVEDEPGSCRGLGLLDFETTFKEGKRLRNVEGVIFPGSGHEAPLRGYEIHMGESRGAALERPAAILEGHPDGAVSEDGQILASYVHGVFDRPEACAAVLSWAGLDGSEGVNLDALREASLERLADCIEKNLDLEAILPYLWRK
jgi:adenosylcobyric acid synthase